MGILVLCVEGGRFGLEILVVFLSKARVLLPEDTQIQSDVSHRHTAACLVPQEIYQPELNLRIKFFFPPLRASQLCVCVCVCVCVC